MSFYPELYLLKTVVYPSILPLIGCINGGQSSVCLLIGVPMDSLYLLVDLMTYVLQLRGFWLGGGCSKPCFFVFSELCVLVERDGEHAG